MKRYLFLLSFVFATSASADCGDTFKDVKLRDALGTTSLYANIRGSNGSLKALSAQLIEDGMEKGINSFPPENLCPAGCTSEKTPLVYLLSVPNKELTDYDDRATCEALLEKTSGQPVIFKDKSFDDLSELNSYYGNLSQGSGTDGKELYRICHSSCSLTYRSFIKRNPNGYSMEVEAVCGHARDKEEGNYRLTSFLRWRCTKGI